MKIYYKIRQTLLQNVTTILLRYTIGVHCKMHQAFSYNIRQFYYKMQRSYYKMQQLLQNATFIANRDSTCGKCSFEIKLFIK